MTIWERIKLAWRVLRRGDLYDPIPNLYRSIESLDHTDLTGAVKLSFEKLRNEPKYPGRPRLWDVGNDNEKQREVKKWAYVYAKNMKLENISEWHINFWIELLVGIEKGKL